MNARLACATLLCLGMVSAALAADKVDLKLKYLPGTYTVTTDMDADTTTTVGDNKMPAQNAKMTMVIKMVVTPAEGGKKNIDLRFEKIKQSVTNAGGEMSYDSSAPADKQPAMLAQAYAPLLAAKLSMVLDENNKIIETKGWEEMMKNMGPSGAALGSSFSDKAMRQMIEQTQSKMPSKPVGVGDTYDTKTTLPMPMIGDMDMKYDMKVKSIDGSGDDQTATVEFSGDVGSEKPTTTQMGQAKMTIDSVKMTQQGEAKINVKLGLASSTNFTQEMNMAMTVPGPEGKDMKTTVKSVGKINSTTTFEPAK